MATKPSRGAIVRAPSPARDPNSKAPPPDARIRECMRIMSDGEWGGYPTRVRLAELWGISEETVRKHSAEASRRLQMDPEQLEEFRQSQAFFFERIKREAVSRRHAISGLPDWMSALKAAELALKCQRIDLEPNAAEAPEIAMKVIIEVASVPPKKKPGDDESGGAPASV